MNDILSGGGGGSPIIPIRNMDKNENNRNTDHEHKPHHLMDSYEHNSCHTTNHSKLFTEPNLMEDLWNLLKSEKLCSYRHFASYLKSYIQHVKEKITVNDLQKMYQKLGISVSLYVLKKILTKYCTIDDNGNIVYSKFLKCLKWKPLLDELNSGDSYKSGVTLKDGNDLNSYETSSSGIGNHNYPVLTKSAGIPSVRSDLQKPKHRSILDLNDYGNANDSASIIQPNIFEKYEVHDDNLCALRSKQEIKCILCQSGISVKDHAFEKIWNSVSKNDKASMMEVWNELKDIGLTENKLYD